jgi:hypothetical protein
MKLSKMQPGGEKYREIEWMRQGGVWVTQATLFEVGAGFIPARISHRADLRAGINSLSRPLREKNIIQTGRCRIMFLQILTGHDLFVDLK